MILGAGIGSRLDPLTRSLPKPLVPIVGKPVMGHLLDLLARHGISDVMVNVQYLGHKIQESIGDGSAYGMRVSYSVEQELCGDAGGVKRVEAFFRNPDDPTEPFLVLGGDDLTDTDLSRLIAFHQDKGATATLAVTPVDDPSEYGIVVLDDANGGRITRFQEKPKPGEAFSNLANTGIYCFQPKVFDYIPAGTFFGFGNNVFPALMNAGEIVAGLPSNAYWKDVGNLAIYRQAQRDCMDGKCNVEFGVSPMRKAYPGQWVDVDALIIPGAELVGPVVIGSNAHIEGNVKDYSVVGEKSVVEVGATIVNSILWPGAVVKAGTHLENCVVGEGVTVQSSHAIFNGLIVDPHRPA